MANKKFYWLKLKEDFFEEDTLQWLEEQDNGKEYCLFYLKLCLKSLKSNGTLIRNVGQMLVPYDAKKLSEITRTDIDTVRVAMEVFKRIGLVQVLDNGEIYLTQLENMVGSETKWAEYKKKQRKLDNVQNDSNNIPKIVHTEIENRDRDKEIEKELDIDIDITKVIETWNSLNLNKLVSIKNNRLKALKARIKEFSKEDVFKAIGNIKESSFLQGKNDRSWTITFDWFLKPNNFIKVLEGNYKDKELNNGFNTNNSRIKEEESGVSGTTAPGWEGVKSFDT